MKKIFYLLVISVLILITGCIDSSLVYIVNGDALTIKIGEIYDLNYETTENLSDKAIWSISNNNVSINSDGHVTGITPGETIIWVYVGDYSDKITVTVLDQVYDFKLTIDKINLLVGESATLSIESSEIITNLTYLIISGDEFAYISNNSLVSIAVGTVEIVCYNGFNQSNKIIVDILPSNDIESIIISSDDYYLNVGAETILSFEVTPGGIYDINYEIIEGNEFGEIIGNVLIAKAEGEIKIVGKYQDIYSKPIVIFVNSNNKIPDEVIIRIDKDFLEVGDTASLSFETIPSDANKNITYEIIEGSNNISIKGNIVTVINNGPAMIVGIIDSVISNIISINTDNILTDPYVNVIKEDFYKDYYEATSYLDSYYRTLHGLMSGSIEEQNQEPTISRNRPMENGLYLRNSSSLYSEDKNTYYIVDENGKVVNTIYRGGGYVTLEEVAAYVLAFGDIPANYSEKKSGKPSSNEWGIYLRLNHSNFSGDTSRYPYEPVLPRISGCGGDLYYYEIDMGTTGTDCDPSYEIKPYNDGKTITRGAARIVYTRYDANKNKIIDINEKYVFYTYNHYNDFQEYLNYEGGWGEMFGNITGGGVLSSKTNYNPTSYVKTTLRNFACLISINNYVIFKKHEYII